MEWWLGVKHGMSRATQAFSYLKELSGDCAIKTYHVFVVLHYFAFFLPIM